MSVSLQINLAPSDYRHAKLILPHQLKILSSQVDEIILTVDTKPGKGRFAEGWNLHEELLNKFLRGMIAPVFNVKIEHVDYSSQTQKKIAQYFFGLNTIPVKDYRGGPFYAYFFGLFSANNNLVLHLDSDIFLGGGSSAWIHEAIELFKSDSSCFIVSPLPGPPHVDDILIDQQVESRISAYTWHLKGMSTRIFFVDKNKFKKNKLVLSRPSLRNQIKAIVQGNSNADLPEHLIAAFMSFHQLRRIDFLGSGKGLWSLHPPYRTAKFYNELPGLIQKIETHDLPIKQQGFYDIIDDVCDWSLAREKLKSNRWWKEPKR